MSVLAKIKELIHELFSGHVPEWAKFSLLMAQTQFFSSRHLYSNLIATTNLDILHRLVLRKNLPFLYQQNIHLKILAALLVLPT